ncbi:hypothetical protein RJ639_031050 [Escallonia herrerae]|uniref:Cell cycle checkpoint protein RAD17 n=1 Tax=Escallonia herrerae TaxID=1293975 RepID=A0AA88X5C8_9ASTE|nr:hypothetical protein RJ639_031050 [Escallonia herrerae]
MGKRTTIFISSSDDEDKDSNSSYSKSKLKSSSVPRTNPKRAKKACLTNSSSRLSKEANPFDEVLRSGLFGLRHEMMFLMQIRRFCEDFDEGFTGFKVSAAISHFAFGVPYAPCFHCVHPACKVEEVKSWFEERLGTAKLQEEVCNNVLLITGQAGVGKSATVHVIASHLGALLCEWNTPTPTIWQEHLHNSNAGMRYMSKLDEFENFVERIRKYGLIPQSCTGGSEKSTILLIDDLPVVYGKVASRRLHSCLHLLAQSIRIPTAILITDYSKADAGDFATRCLEELQLSLQSAGTCKVAFNPITVNSIKKILFKICREEQFKVTAEEIDLIAKASGGDIRHAITSLQYFCLKPHPMLSLSCSNGTPTYPRERCDEINQLDDRLSTSFCRDETLSLFHALGKFLHNKRETENSIPPALILHVCKPSSPDSDVNVCIYEITFELFLLCQFSSKTVVKRQPVPDFLDVLNTSAYLLRERFKRSPLKMDAPEKVLSQAHGQARPIADFLHENVLDFLGEEASDDAWVVASYLSDADRLLASVNGILSRNYEAENVLQSAAASVAVRGVLFGNCHPLSSRWHAIRRPKLWQVEQSQWHKKVGLNLSAISSCNPSSDSRSLQIEMVSQRSVGYNGINLSDLTLIATESKPVLKWLGSRASDGVEAHRMSMAADVVEDDHNNEINDDEIEDW